MASQIAAPCWTSALSSPQRHWKGMAPWTHKWRLWQRGVKGASPRMCFFGVPIKLVRQNDARKMKHRLVVSPCHPCYIHMLYPCSVVAKCPQASLPQGTPALLQALPQHSTRPGNACITNRRHGAGQLWSCGALWAAKPEGRLKWGQTLSILALELGIMMMGASPLHATLSCACLSAAQHYTTIADRKQMAAPTPDPHQWPRLRLCLGHPQLLQLHCPPLGRRCCSGRAGAGPARFGHWTAAAWRPAWGTFIRPGALFGMRVMCAG